MAQLTMIYGMGRIQLRHITTRRRRVKIGHRVLVATIAALTASASLATPATAAPGTLEQFTPASKFAWLTPEKYAQRFGAERAANEVPNPTPAGIKAAESESVSGDTGNFSALDVDHTSWWNFMHDDYDLAGRHIPLRLGNSEIGYLHYASPHNIHMYWPIHQALQTHTPDRVNGNRVEYIEWFTDLSNGNKEFTIRMIAQNADYTSDGRYLTPDGAPIGVITAYCENMNRCPNSVDADSPW